MKMKLILMSAFLGIFNIALLHAAHDGFVAGARQSAMSSSGVTSSDFWSVYNNQAGLGFVRTLSAGAYMENRFLVKELSFKAAGVAIPVSTGTFGIGISHFGFTGYNEIKAGLGFGKTFGENFAAGLQLDYLQTQIGDVYGKKSAFTFEAGILTKLTPKLNLGVHVFNPVKTRLAEYNNEMIPMVFNMGAMYFFSDQLAVTAEIEKHTDYKTAFKTGFEYQPAKMFFIRGGISSASNMYSLGAGVLWKCFRIDFSSSYHQTLGFSPQFSLIYEVCK